MIANKTVINIWHDIARSCRFAIQLVKNLISFAHSCSFSTAFGFILFKISMYCSLAHSNMCSWAICSCFKQAACCFANDSSCWWGSLEAPLSPARIRDHCNSPGSWWNMPILCWFQGEVVLLLLATDKSIMVSTKVIVHSSLTLSHSNVLLYHDLTFDSETLLQASLFSPAALSWSEILAWLYLPLPPRLKR
jgi:hypothetical protein